MPSLTAGGALAVRIPAAGEAITAGRAAEFAATAEKMRSGVSLLPLEDHPGTAGSSLRISMLAPRVDVGGGARIIFEHANRLFDRGHDVAVLAHFPRPDWFPLRARYQHVPAGWDLADHLPPSDLIVCGYWDQIGSARAAGIAPVIHFEQGDFHLFEDIDRAQHALVASHLRAADATMTVSRRVAGVLAGRYGIDGAHVVHNAVDPGTFRADGPPPLQGSPYVLCVGWDGNDFKGIQEARQVWKQLHATRPDLSLVWVTPRPPRDGPLGEVVVSPSQQQLAALYRGAAAYLCASRYESFPLPPIEAMSSGTPVVTTDNVGVLEYAVDGENALVVPVGDTRAMIGALERVLDDPGLSRRLRVGGLRTAASFVWDRIIADLEDFYRRTARRRIARTGESANRGEWKDVLRDGDIGQERGEERIEIAKQTSGAREIWAPVARPAWEGLEVVSWEIVARRTRGGAGAVRVPVLHRAPGFKSRLPYQHAIAAIAERRYSAALARLIDSYNTSRSPSRQGAVAKWLAVALLGAGRAGEAMSVIEAGVAEFADNPDYICLAASVGPAAGMRVDLAGAAASAAMLGQGSRYDDWLCEPASLIGRSILP